MMKSILRVATSAVLFVLACTGQGIAQTVPKVLDTGLAQPSSAIFIGNSYFYYNNGINAHLIRLIRAVEPSSKFRTTM